MPVTSTSWTKDGPRPKARGKDKRTLLLAAIKKATGMDEEEYYAHLVTLSETAPGHEFLKKEILARMYVPYKATLPAIELDLPENATMEQKLEAITTAVANGDVTPDIGDMLLRMLKTIVEINEKTEMAKRIEAIEEMLKGQQDAPQS